MMLPEPGSTRTDLYHGLFQWHVNDADGQPRVSTHKLRPATIPCPTTGRLLRVATLEAGSAICPSCAMQGHGGFVTFETDLRMAYACPQCLQLVWVLGL